MPVQHIVILCYRRPLPVSLLLLALFTFHASNSATATGLEPSASSSVSDEAVYNGASSKGGIEDPLDEEIQDIEAFAKPKPDNEKEKATFVKLFSEGVKAYDDQLWYSCAFKFENAVKDFHKYRNSLTDCRIHCNNDARFTKMANFSSNLVGFSTFSKFLKVADCFRRCKEDTLGMRPKKRVPEYLEEAFLKRRPYHYLQFCYHKLDRPKLAASAAYTYFLAHPNDSDTKANIKFYRDKANVPESDFVDLEIVPYKEYYIRGTMAYVQESWKAVIENIERSLSEYFVEHERCVVDCQAKTKMKDSEFMTGVADLIIQVLMCQLDCKDKLSQVYTEPIPFFLQDMLHYLQFAYYQDKDIERSAEATASFLLLNSSHEVMRDNKQVLISMMGLTEDDFKPRQDILRYIDERKEMLAAMDFINKNYKWPDLEEMVEDTPDLDLAFQEEEHDDWITRYEKLGMHVIAKASDLHRDERFVSDGLLKPEQCEELLTLVESLKRDESGKQVFNLKIAQETLEKDPNEEYETSLRLFVRVAEIVRHYTLRYLEPEDMYYFKHSSIVCWEKPKDLMTKVNCLYQEDGSCIKLGDMSDELYSDVYTTVTYLNTADEDGDFIFLKEDGSVDSTFGVKCGRTVGFNTGDRHTLKLPKDRSQRCAMVIHYTMYHSDDDQEYRNMLAMLQRVDELRMAQTSQSAKIVMQKFAERGVKVVKTGKELMGKERFVADGLATDNQCSTLHNMVQELGKAGDGYEGKHSPHTRNEMFAGLSLVQVAQSGALVGDGYDHLTSKPSFISPHTEHELYQGITVYRASKLTNSGMVSTIALRAFLELSEDSRLLVEKYFNLTRPLYHDYTHLVCRTAIDDSKYNRQDLSHPVHADNCLLQPDGSCTKDYPAFVQRDYSAILYLNSNFEGGEFFFAHSNKTEQSSVRPKCGRLVGFNAGSFHGVRAVKSGQRCALALWFTHNPNFKELAHIQARKVLKIVEEDQKQQQQSRVHEDL